MDRIGKRLGRERLAAWNQAASIPIVNGGADPAKDKTKTVRHDRPSRYSGRTATPAAYLDDGTVMIVRYRFDRNARSMESASKPTGTVLKAAY